MSYSIDFRRKVISTREEEGLSIRETAKQFRIGPASVSHWINQIASKASTTRQRKSDKSELIKDVEPYPDAYQKERAERFGVCQKAIWQALKKLGLTYKKTLLFTKNIIFNKSSSMQGIWWSICLHIRQILTQLRALLNKSELVTTAPHTGRLLRDANTVRHS
ncbi:IS630 transposase-related protein [Symbiopectobacterium sp. RP]|uniref:IS630 transposase-related protein n=1 Tax=Symbiopectobacterium sp. RP TaxID=3248553 RepID=UPI003D278CF9